jgi:hypothetical protein
MNGNELAAKIRAECKYTGANKSEFAVYQNAIGAAIGIVLRELPEPVVPVKKKPFVKADEE